MQMIIKQSLLTLQVEMVYSHLIVELAEQETITTTIITVSQLLIAVQTSFQILQFQLEQQSNYNMISEYATSRNHLLNMTNDLSLFQAIKQSSQD